MFCLEPKLKKVPDGEFLCPKCKTDEASSPPLTPSKTKASHAGGAGGGGGLRATGQANGVAAAGDDGHPEAGGGGGGGGGAGGWYRCWGAGSEHARYGWFDRGPDPDRNAHHPSPGAAAAILSVPGAGRPRGPPPLRGPDQAADGPPDDVLQGPVRILRGASP
ncbi:unnamed protein product [Ectocarpus sp. 12 AP-2014]